jgi:uncharacterized protein YgbK (DUF1537 family)
MTDACASDGRAVCIVADDLTGALDAAGPFAASGAAVSVYWDACAAASHAGERVALDTACRELPGDKVIARTRAAVDALWSRARCLAFLKVDSVWRGNPAAAIAAAAGAFERIVVAPAFPEQGRVTRGGGQWVVEGGGVRCVVPDIASELRGHGVDAATQAQASPSTRVVVCDAESPADLAAIVERHSRDGVHTLWCGTRGLARALAARSTDGEGSPSMTAAADAPVALRAPVLFVVGTDHPVSVAQAAALEGQPGVACRTVDTAAAGDDPALTDGAAAVLLRFAIAGGTPRDAARERIAEALRREVGCMRTPGTVVATGGETVRALGEALGATRLDVHAEYEPGIPRGVWGDGRWAGTPILTKSGGFGAPDLFARLAASAARDTHCTRNTR